MSRWSAVAIPGDLPIVQWRHDSAQAWLDHLAGVLHQDPVNLQTEQRCAALLDLVQSVRAVYLALDLPPSSDPEWAHARCSRFAGGMPGGATEGTWVHEAYVRLFADTSCPVDLSQPHRFDPRVDLRPDASMDVTTMRTPFADGGDPCEQWDRWDWWRDTCPWGDAPIAGWVRVPLDHTWELFATVGATLVARGLDEIVRSSRVYVTRENVRIATEQHLDDPTGLIGMAAANLAAAHDPSTELRAVQGVLATTATTAATLGGPVGWVVAAIAGLAYGVAELFGSFAAVGHILDCFGRDYPQFEPVRLTGSLVPEREPTGDVPPVPPAPGAAPVPGFVPLFPAVVAFAPPVVAVTCQALRPRSKRNRCLRRERRLARLASR